MKKIGLLLIFVPFLLTAQSKKEQKRLLAVQQKINAQLTTQLQKHVQYLSDDVLEGRRTGTKGEMLAVEYIVKEYEQAGLLPKGTDGYVQPFPINEGKLIDSATHLKVNDQLLVVQQHYFPLVYSASTLVNTDVAMALNEPNKPWFKDVKDWMDENQNNPHYDIENDIKKYVAKIIQKGATALFLYNSSNGVDNIQFNKNDTTAQVNIPIIYLTKVGIQQYFKDIAATQKIQLSVDIKARTRKGHNVVAFINNNATHTVILGAHLDHLGYGEDKNALDAGNAIHNGADDNASGTAALIELAKMLKQNTNANNNYLIIHFSGEELGLLGSKYWLQNPTIKISPNYMINLDMVGRYDSARKLTIGGYGTSPVWQTVFENTINKNLVYKLDSSGSGPSDHASFYRANIPVLFFFTGSHSDYHKATDDWDKINYEGQREIVQYIMKLIETANSKGKFSFTKTAEPVMGKSTRFTVSLGVIPDYGYTGKGVRIEGVSAGKLAEKIGLQAGDILLQLGDYKFADVMSYMQALAAFKKGDTTTLIIQRNNNELKFNINF
ncbi:MAG: M28 family peptidase [Chitinophagaceae bacterium]